MSNHRESMLPDIIDVLASKSAHQEDLENLIREMESAYVKNGKPIDNLLDEVEYSLDIGTDLGLLKTEEPSNIIRLKFNPNSKVSMNFIRNIFKSKPTEDDKSERIEDKEANIPDEIDDANNSEHSEKQDDESKTDDEYDENDSNDEDEHSKRRKNKSNSKRRENIAEEDSSHSFAQPSRMKITKARKRMPGANSLGRNTFRSRSSSRSRLKNQLFGTRSNNNDMIARHVTRRSRSKHR